MNSIALILGILLVSFGLVARSTALVKTRKDHNYHPMMVQLVPVSLGAISFFGWTFHLISAAAYLLINRLAGWTTPPAKTRAAVPSEVWGRELSGRAADSARS